eukprot:Nk52_evm24s78 gene=Nk52_evmTU24s78
MVVIKSILIITSSGVVLFAKEYGSSIHQPRLLGSLLTALFQTSHDVIAPVSYVRFGSLSLSICSANTTNSNILAAVLYEGEVERLKVVDALAGRSLVKVLLDAFLKEYSTQIEKGGKIVNTTLFEGFEDKIQECQNAALNPLLYRIADDKSVRLAVIFKKNGTFFSSQPVEQLGFVANMEALLNYSKDLMTNSGSQSLKKIEIIMKGAKYMIFLFQDSCLAIVVDKNLTFGSLYKGTIDAIEAIGEIEFFVSSGYQ